VEYLGAVAPAQKWKPLKELKDIFQWRQGRAARKDMASGVSQQPQPA